jgi:hypothetical protein
MMRLLVIHDVQGDIKLVGLIGDQVTGKVGFQAKEGEVVTEVEAPDDIPSTDLLDKRTHDYVRNLARNSRIEVSGKHPRLVPKKSMS